MFFYSQDKLRGFFRIEPLGGHGAHPGTSCEQQDVVLRFSHLRFRRTHAQVTHVWVRCQ